MFNIAANPQNFVGIPKIDDLCKTAGMRYKFCLHGNMQKEHIRKLKML